MCAHGGHRVVSFKVGQGGILDNRIVGILCIVSVLGGCGYSVDQLVANKELRMSILQECAGMGIAAKDAEKCSIAAEAEVEAIKQAAQGLMDKLKK